MDYNILKTFRVFYQDYVLLFDAIQEYHRVRPSNKSLKEFTSGVAAMIEVEASIEKVQQGIVVTSKGETESEYSGLGLIVEIIRSVILEFIADEISQYPFWSVKLAATSFPSGMQSTWSLVQGTIVDKYQRGVIFRGFHPYLAASMIENYSVLVSNTRALLKAIAHRLPRSPSIDRVIKSMSPTKKGSTSNVEGGRSSMNGGKGLGGLRSKKSTALGLNDYGKTSPLTAQKDREIAVIDRNVVAATSVKNSLAENNFDIWRLAWTAFPACAAAAIAHPLIVLSVRMATETDYSASSSSLLSTENWLPSSESVLGSVVATATKFLVDIAGETLLRSCVMILAREGRWALYAGVRSKICSAALYCAIPLSMTSLFGLYETVFYRSALSFEGCASVAKEFSGDSLLQVLRSIVNREGYFNLFRYGLLSTLQIGPGFVSFVGTRYLQWLIFGSSQQRIRQRLMRKKVLSSFWSGSNYSSDAGANGSAKGLKTGTPIEDDKKSCAT